MPFKNYRDESRSNWGTETDGAISRDEIKIGALLRLADAAEVMSKNHQALINERDYYLRVYKESTRDNRLLERKIAAYKGIIRRLKNNATK